MSRILNAIRCSVGFFTIIPTRCRDLESGMIYWLFLPAAIIGGVSSILYYFTYLFIGPLLAAAVALSGILVLSGFTHLDGVLDAADALMFRGERSRKLEILKDHNLGAGGFGTALVIYLLTFGVLTELGPLSGSFAILIAEITSKVSFLIGLQAGRPLFTSELFNRFRTFTSNGGLSALAINSALALILAVIFGYPYILAFLISGLIALILVAWMNKAMGGINGDILGLTGEITRLTYLVSVAVMLIIVRTALLIPPV